MDFLQTPTKKLYFKFLFPSMMSALVTSIYFFVDAIAVGQSEGALGTAAMAVTSPTYGVMAFLAVLCGVGGSVMMSMAKGQGEDEKGNACFTSAVVLMSALTIALWLAFILFREQVFALFGANAEVMPKTVEYGKWIIWFLPLFVFTPFMGAFIRNDGAPGLVMAAVVLGGDLNVFGDWFLVFPMKMGMTGAAIASVMGMSVQCVILASHFFRKACGLKLVRPRRFLRGFQKTLQIGIGASALDLGAVTIGMMINNKEVMEMAQGMEKNGEKLVVTKKQAKFHRAVALVSQTLGALLLIAMGSAALSDDGRTNWSGAIWGLMAGLYLIGIGRWAYKAYHDGAETPVQSVRVVRWFNLASFVLFLLGIAFLIGNIIDPTLYQKMGLDF